MTQLRQALGGDATYTVVKNTLTRRAAAEAGVSIDDSLLVGPTAIAFVKGDPVAAAKGLRDFAKTNPLLVIKGGVMEGRSLSAAEVNQIADLESREVLLAQIAGVLKALPSRAAGLFQAPLSQVARLAQALADKTPAEAAAPASETAHRRPRPKPPTLPRLPPTPLKHLPTLPRLPPTPPKHLPTLPRLPPTPPKHPLPPRLLPRRRHPTLPPSRRSSNQPICRLSRRYRKDATSWRSSALTSSSTRSRSSPFSSCRHS